MPKSALGGSALERITAQAELIQKRRDEQAQREAELRQLATQNAVKVLDRTSPLVSGNNILSTQRTQTNPIQAEARRQRDIRQNGSFERIMGQMDTEGLTALRDDVQSMAMSLDPALNPDAYNRTARLGQKLENALSESRNRDYYTALNQRIQQAEGGVDQSLVSAGLSNYRSIPNKPKYDNLRSVAQYLSMEASQNPSTEGFGYAMDYKANQMTQAQKNTVLYYIGAGEYDKASQYLSDIERELNERANSGFQETMTQWAQEHPVQGALTNMFSWPLSIPATVDNLGEAVRQKVTGEYAPADVNRDAYLGARIGTGTSQGVQEAAREAATDTFGSETAGDVAAFLAGNGLSIGQNITRLPLGPLNLPAMAASGAGTGMVNALDRGATPGQAAVLGLSEGLIEALTEKLPLENLYRLAGQTGKQGVGQVVRGILGQMGTEAAEETISEIAGNLVDTAVMRDKSEYQSYIRQLVDSGMSQEQAEWKAFLQFYVNNTLQAAVGGALSGGVMGGGATAISAIANRNSAPAETTPRIRREDRGMLVPGPSRAASMVEQGTQAETPQTASEGQNNTASTGETVVANTSLFDRGVLKNFNDARKKLISYAREHFPSSVRNRDTGKTIGISRNGLDKFLSGNIYYEKYASGFHIPELIERAHKVADAGNYHEETAGDIPTYEYYDSPMTIDGREYTAHIRVRNTLVGDRYYGHTVSQVENIEIEPSTRASAPENPAVQSVKIDGSIERPTDTGSDSEAIAPPPNRNAQSVPPSGPSNNSLPPIVRDVNGQLQFGIMLPKAESADAAGGETRVNDQVEDMGPLPIRLPGPETETRVNDSIQEEGAVRADTVASNYSQYPWMEQLEHSPIENLPPDSVGAASMANDPWAVFQNMSNQFIPTGENPARTIEIPLKDPEGRNISWAARTVMEAQATPEDMLGDIAEAIMRGELSHDVLTDKAAMGWARDIIESEGFASAMARFKQQVNRGNGGKNTVALGQVLLNNAMNAGDAKATIDILTDYASLSTRTGQALQAQRMFKKLAPEGQLYGIQRSVLNLQEEVQKNFPDATIEIDPELVREFQNQTDQTGRDQVMEKIYQNVADQVPSSWRDKWNAWRYMAMLANPRTHIRNFFGNLLFQPFRIIKDKVASGVEGLVGAVNPNFQKTKSFAASPSLYKAAWKDWKNVKEVLSGNKYDDIRSEINSRRTIFRSKAARPLELVRRGNSAVLEAEDAIFKRLTYTDALAGYLHANGVTAEQLANGEVNSDLLTKARDYAGQEALKATYQDRNQFSDLISRRFQEDTTASKAANTAIDAVLPFRRTPANILVRGFEYSPLGLAKSLTADLVQVKQGKMSGAQAIDNIAAGLTGSALFGLGMYLLSEGLVTSGGSDDEEQEDLNALTGKQNYALNLPGGGSVTLDWLAPEALPFFMGVEFMEALGEGGFDLETITDALSSISEPMLELSMLQSLNDLIDSVSFAESSEKMVSMAGSALVSYLTQAIPTLGGQIERTSESDRMSSFTDRNSPIPRDLQYALSRASARLPGDYQQIPYIDAWGRTESNGGPFERAFNNFLNPAYTSTTNITAADEEIQRLLDAGQTGVVPDRVSQSQKVDGQYLTSDQYVQYATTKGQTSYDIVAEMIGSDLYQDMTDEQKADAIKTAYQYAGHIAAEEVSPSHEADSYVEAAKNAQKDMGISTAEYLLLYDTYGKSGVDRIKKMMDAGTDLNAAIEATTSIDGLEPETGEDDVSDLQKYRAVIDSISNVDQQMSALSSVMNESTYTKVSVGYDFGVSPNAYVTVKEILPQFDEPNDKGNLGTYTQEEYEAALDSLSGGSPILPGDTRVNLTNDQKAVLWQLLTGSKSAKNNPYSRSIGQQVIDALESAKGQKDNTSQSYSGLLNLPMA